jgi:hypothetical protein
VFTRGAPGGVLAACLTAALVSACTGSSASSASSDSQSASSGLATSSAASAASSGAVGPAPASTVSAAPPSTSAAVTPTATSTPTPTPTSTSTSTSTPTVRPTPKPTKKKYGYGLPSGPATPGPELLVYEPLRLRDCHGAQTTLGEPDHDGQWQSLPDPSKVLLFQAGVAACLGDLKTAQHWLTLDRTLFKATTAEDPDIADAACPLYRALVSVLNQVAQGTVKCPTGAQPAWITGPNGDSLDPRTHSDAYAHPPSSPAASSATPSPTSVAS